MKYEVHAKNMQNLRRETERYSNDSVFLESTVVYVSKLCYPCCKLREIYNFQNQILITTTMAQITTKIITSISCRRFKISFSLFPCLGMNFIATVCRSQQQERLILETLNKITHPQETRNTRTWPLNLRRPLYTLPNDPSPTSSMT